MIFDIKLGFMTNILKRIIKKLFLEGKRCPHGSTSWYICPRCKKEFPEWAPFEGEGPYNPNLYEL